MKMYAIIRKENGREGCVEISNIREGKECILEKYNSYIDRQVYSGKLKLIEIDTCKEKVTVLVKDKVEPKPPKRKDKKDDIREQRSA